MQNYDHKTGLTLKRKSVVVSFGYYSLASWDVEVVQFARTYLHRWCWISHSNNPPGHPDHRTLRQMRAACLATARERARAYDVPFVGVRPVVYAKSAKRLANAFDIHEHRAFTLLDCAQAALGGVKPALKWLSSPAKELSEEIPARLARTGRGWYRVCDALLRKQYAWLVNEGFGRIPKWT